MANDFWTSANVDPKRKYRFIVELAGQNGIGSLWFAKTVDKPEITIGTGEVDFMQHKFYYPGRVEWNEIAKLLKRFQVTSTFWSKRIEFAKIEICFLTKIIILRTLILSKAEGVN